MAIARRAPAKFRSAPAVARRTLAMFWRTLAVVRPALAIGRPALVKFCPALTGAASALVMFSHISSNFPANQAIFGGASVLASRSRHSIWRPLLNARIKPAKTKKGRVNKMAKNQTKRIRPAILQADRDALAAIAGITGYTPANTDYTLTKLQNAGGAMDDAQETETQKSGEADAARDDAGAAEWNFHNSILGAKAQVKAQFGDDSNEWQSLGQTKKSEFAKPSAKVKPAAAVAAK
jgi:hypothetical protein